MHSALAQFAEGLPFAERAAVLLERGFSVIPVQPKSKHTIVGAGERTRDRAVVIARARHGFRDANVGLCADENHTLLESDNVQGFRARCRELSGGLEIPPTDVWIRQTESTGLDI